MSEKIFKLLSCLVVSVDSDMNKIWWSMFFKCSISFQKVGDLYCYAFHKVFSISLYIFNASNFINYFSLVQLYFGFTKIQLHLINFHFTNTFINYPFILLLLIISSYFSSFVWNCFHYKCSLVYFAFIHAKIKNYSSKLSGNYLCKSL